MNARLEAAILWMLVALIVAGAAAELADAAHSRRYVVARHTIAGLRYYDRAGPIPMRHTGWILEQAGHDYNVNPALIAGIAAKETELGRTACLPFNAWGLGACGRAWTPPAFTSWRQSIRYMARHLRRRFLDHGIQTIEGILAGGYCVSGCGSWTYDVARFMRPFGLGTGTRYPR